MDDWATPLFSDNPNFLRDCFIPCCCGKVYHVHPIYFNKLDSLTFSKSEYISQFSVSNHYQKFRFTSILLIGPSWMVHQLTEPPKLMRFAGSCALAGEWQQAAESVSTSPWNQPNIFQGEVDGRIQPILGQWWASSCNTYCKVGDLCQLETVGITFLRNLWVMDQNLAKSWQRLPHFFLQWTEENCVPFFQGTEFLQKRWILDTR